MINIIRFIIATSFLLVALGIYTEVKSEDVDVTKSSYKNFITYCSVTKDKGCMAYVKGIADAMKVYNLNEIPKVCFDKLTAKKLVTAQKAFKDAGLDETLIPSEFIIYTYIASAACDEQV